MKRKGFTLVELLIVIAIIGILATMMTMSTSSGTNSAKAASITSGLRTLKSAIAMFTGDYITSTDITGDAKKAIALFEKKSDDYIDTASLANMRKSYHLVQSGDDEGGSIYAGYKFGDSEGKVKERIVNIAGDLSLKGGKWDSLKSDKKLTGTNKAFKGGDDEDTAFMEIRSSSK